ncbi:hypothetical protein Syun_011964 [Stephania yunnanensis]|uniref:Uncharacterized protein n=1 Tax=Stephania yunnanensis TaxID=152371 RepID=A0AAP0JZB1_9MAGN
MLKVFSISLPPRETFGDFLFSSSDEINFRAHREIRTCSAPNCTCVSIDERKSQQRRNAVTGTQNSRVRDGRNRFSLERSMHIRAKPILVFSDSQLDLQ